MSCGTESSRPSTGSLTPSWLPDARLLRAGNLDCIRERPEIGDQRLADPLAPIEGRRKHNGRWTTLKAPRVLTARQAATTAASS